MATLKKLFFFSATQKVLAFLAENSGREFMEKTITAKTGVKKSSVNTALHELVHQKLVLKKQIGRSALFTINAKKRLVREIKILQNILSLQQLLKELQNTSLKIILFGSSANGTNLPESDIDLFILTNNEATPGKIIANSALAEKIQLITKTPAKMLKINTKKPLLFQEIEKGIVLWDINENEGI